VEQDFSRALERLKKFPERHRAELWQWYTTEKGVSPTLGALLALLRFLQGIGRTHHQPGDRRRLYGLGVQVPLRFLAAVLGRDKSTVCDAIREGERRGFLLRHAYTRKVRHITKNRPIEARLEAVVTKDGEERSSVNVHGVLYLTPKGCDWVDARGTTRAELRARNPRQEGRGHVLTGILWDVLCALREVRRALAARLARPPSHPTPEEEAPHERVSSVVGGATENGPAPPGEAVRPEAADVGTGSSGPITPPRGSASAAAPPPVRPTLRIGWRSPVQGGTNNDGLSGRGALSGAGAEPRAAGRPGYGPPLCPSRYLEEETERCWRRHVIVEGGEPRRVVVKVYGVGGKWYGDHKEILEPGRVKVWDPALTAEEAYPGEWSAAGGIPVVRAQLEADFRLYLGPRLRRRFLAHEEAWGDAGADALPCPVPGCGCWQLRGAR
jgi:hypothetical protein